LVSARYVHTSPFDVDTDV
jgi:endonuclease-3